MNKAELIEEVAGETGLTKTVPKFVPGKNLKNKVK